MCVDRQTLGDPMTLQPAADHLLGALRGTHQRGHFLQAQVFSWGEEEEEEEQLKGLDLCSSQIEEYSRFYLFFEKVRVEGIMYLRYGLGLIAKSGHLIMTKNVSMFVSKYDPSVWERVKNLWLTITRK